MPTKPHKAAPQHAVPPVKPQVITLGCRLNAYESDQMLQLASQAGVHDAIIVNTCAVTNEAVRQARQCIRRARQDAPTARLVVTGCAAQTTPDVFSRMPEVDIVLGNAEKLTPDVWQKCAKGALGPIAVSDIMQSPMLPPLQPATHRHRAREFVQVQNGCDHRCTFCIIPYGRGNARSISPENVIAQVRPLVEMGTHEIVLTGVDLTSYGTDLGDAVTLGTLLVNLLRALPDLHRIRLSSIDGAEIDQQLFTLISNEPRIAPHLHLSLQSGDDMILKRMKRRHNRAQAIDICQRLKAARPEIALGADIIAGFPTETDVMFQNSLSLIELCGLSYVHVFPFSPRQNTPAARMPQLDRAVIKDRAARLRAVADNALSAHLQAHIGRQMPVLTERPNRAGQGIGRLADFSSIRFDVTGQEWLSTPGQMVEMQILSQNGQSLFADATTHHYSGHEQQ